MKVLFVCMGNICRSPTAEAAFRRLAEQEARHLDLLIDSAGTHAYHSGAPPDRRAQSAALLRGIDLSPIRARQVCKEDFERFDLILAMDRHNHELLSDQKPAGVACEIRLFMEYAQNPTGENVPDPYYGGANGFERVLDMIEDASRGLLSQLKESRRRA